MAALCSLVMLLSAFLLFSVQPMVAKMLLPSLGGSPAVWNTAMVFYQAALLAGYTYSHFLAHRINFRNQLVVHGAALIAPALVLPLSYGAMHRPATGSPVGWMLLTMALSVGLPFFVLSATSPLVQSWFSRAGYKDPYFLYAASNVGSFVGLLSYPILVEQNLTVAQQSLFWTLGYVAFVVLLGVTGLQLRKRSTKEVETETAEVRELEPLSWKRRMKWMFLAFLPSSQFIGVTTYLTTDIAVMPLLWVIPLAIYLLTMILVFAKRPPIPHKWVVALFPFILALVLFSSAIRITYAASPFFIFTSKSVIFGIHLLALFAGAMLCHGELAKDRPKPAQLTDFFLWMSIGGVLGGIFNALLAPVIFVQVIEYTVILVLVCLAVPARKGGWTRSAIAMDFAAVGIVGGGIIGLLWLCDRYALMSSQTYRPLLILIGCLLVVAFAVRPLRLAMAVLGMVLVGVYTHQSNRTTLFVGRSFFGVQRVEALERDNGMAHILFNGQVMHGRQILTPELETVPIAYYDVHGPLKEVFSERKPSQTVGVVGLGIGTMALYSRKGEDWTFYEIDELVERLARDPNLFTCLSKAEVDPRVMIGDARLRLIDEPDGKFDLLCLDAFSSDSVPAHLLTTEAIQLYFQKMKPDGLLAVHITNNYLDLEPLMAANARALGLKILVCETTGRNQGASDYGEMTTWCVLAKDGTDLGRFEASDRWLPAKEKAGIDAWSDQHSSLLPLMRWH